MNTKYLITLIIAASVAVVGCKKADMNKTGAASSTTGWAYNSEENGGFEVVTEYQQENPPGTVFVEGGTFKMGRVEQDLTSDWNNVPRRVTVSSFYMDETEVRNVDYREYLFWINRVFAEYPAVYRKALPDTLVWRSKLAYNEPYVEYYFRHPAYNEYPVVGVNWLQANDYCAWRSDRVNEMLLVNRGILKLDPQQAGSENFNTDAYLAGQFEGLIGEQPMKTPTGVDRKVKFEDGILLPKYRLPTEAEWEFAAYSLIGNSFDERIYESRLYPWNGHTLRNDNAKARGQMRANFVRGKGDYMGTAGDLNDNAEITAPVKSYWPNDYGLYCMAGNVSEWVMDVYRALSPEDINEFRPFRGNVFQEVVKDEEGNVAAKDSLGRIRYQDVTTEHAAGRKNYTQADYRNYLDGDVNSSLDYSTSTDDKTKGGSTRMYAQGQNDMSSLVTDNVRVYKGGSWKDRAYWMVPGTRRFMDETASKDDLGFRCAMTHVGSPKGF
jgi:gliding motility-associated lipoprotein GldJ